MCRRLPLVMLTTTVLLCAAAPWSGAPRAQEAGHSPTDLAKATQNPVADLTTIPFQFNFTSGGPLEDRTFYNLNIQPVMPLKVNDEWNLIARTIVPYLSISVPGDTTLGIPERRETGIGDIQEQLFLTPAKAGGLIWGLGPVLSFPTATNEAARTGDWAIGPTAVALKMTGPWVVGALANQLWTVSGDDIGEDVSQLLVQPFINYNLARGWALSTAPVITANWAAPDGEQWTVPIGLGISKVSAIGKQPVNLGLQYYHNAERPSSTGEDTIRFVFALLYPIPKKG